jgi:hypothetical protein
VVIGYGGRPHRVRWNAADVMGIEEGVRITRQEGDEVILLMEEANRG